MRFTQTNIKNNFGKMLQHSRNLLIKNQQLKRQTNV